MENKELNVEERVLEALAELGLVTEDEGNGIHNFNTGAARIAYVHYDEDMAYLTFVMPYLLSQDDYSQLTLMNVIQNVNSNLKYVRAYMVDKYCFVNIDRMLFESDLEGLESIACHMINHLHNAKEYAIDLANKYKAQENEQNNSNDPETPQVEGQDSESEQ